MAQNTFDFAHFWSNLSTILAGKQATLTTTQQNAVNSGVTASKVTQYDKDSAATAELVDSGAKNLLKINASSTNIQGVSFTVNTDGTVSASGTNTGSSSATLIIVPNADVVKIPDGDYVLSGCPAGGSSDTFDLRWFRYSTNKSAYDTGASAEVSKSGNTNDSNIAIVVKAGVTINATFAPMLCAKAAWDVSQTFEQYAPTNRELYEMIQALQAGT